MDTAIAVQLRGGMQGIGFPLSSGASWDGANVNLSSLSSLLGDALPTFAEVLRSPAFAAEEIGRLRSENLDRLAVSLSEPGTLAHLTAARVVCRSAPARRPQTEGLSSSSPQPTPRQNG
jgi:zinc protease